jgi:hypothetical protein
LLDFEGRKLFTGVFTITRPTSAGPTPASAIAFTTVSVVMSACNGVPISSAASERLRAQPMASALGREGFARRPRPISTKRWPKGAIAPSQPVENRNVARLRSVVRSFRWRARRSGIAYSRE